MKLSRVILLVGGLALSLPILAQDAGGFKDTVAGHPDFSPTAKGMHLEANVGSFSIKRGNEQPDEGTLDIRFTGTVLVGGLKGTAVPGNGVKLAYKPAGIDREVFHGTGNLKISGQFTKIIFFGRDMHALYNGTGLVEVTGEFDKNLNTGYFWYNDDFKNKKYWFTGIMTIPPVPPKNEPGSQTKINIRRVGGKG